MLYISIYWTNVQESGSIIQVNNILTKLKITHFQSNRS